MAADPGPMRLQSPAKINLFLAVTGRRPDGYHDLRTLMCPLTLADTVTLAFHGQTGVRCDHPDVPEDETNLALRAARAFMAASGRSGPVAIAIEKRIPVAGGLGGGSSNAAAALAGLNRRWGNPLAPDALSRVALSIGADVPFFLFGRPALATGVGERLSNLPNLPFYHVLLVCMPFGVSTASVYKNLKLALTKSEKINKKYPLETWGFDPRRHLSNDLEAVTASMHPEVMAAKSALMAHGAEGAMMSGSGPTVFGLFRSDHEAAAAGKALAGAGPWRVLQTALAV